MYTISQLVDDALQHSPFLLEALQENIANVTSVARRLQPQIEAKLLEDVSEEAVAMAVRRSKARLTQPQSGTKFLKDLNNITVRSNLVEFVFPTSLELTKIHQTILRDLGNKPDTFLNISRGLFESIIVVSIDAEPAIQKILKQQKGVSKITDLSSITILFPKETITTPGVYYPLLQQLAWHNINVIEIISIAKELSLLFKSNDVDRAFSVLKSISA